MLSNVGEGLSKNTISGKQIKMYHYLNNDGGLMIIRKKSQQYYIISFNTDRDLFLFYWPKAKKVFDSFDIKGSNFTDANNMTAGIKVRFSPDWKIGSNIHNSTILKLIPNDPLWTHLTYSTTIQLISSPTYGGPHSDYKMSLDWFWQTKKWTATVEQISAYQKKIKPESTILTEKGVEAPDFSNTAGGGSHVGLGIDLGLIGNPKNYVVFSNVISSFKLQGGPQGSSQYCSLVDNTNWVPLPPPRIDIFLNPSSLNIVPGEMQTAEVLANSSSDLPAFVYLNPTSYKGVNFIFFPAKIYLPSNGKGSSTMQIIPSNNLIKSVNGSKDITVPINGYIDFPQNITDATTGVSYKSNQTEKIRSQAFLHSSILGWWDRFIEQSTWAFSAAGSGLNQFAGMLTALAGITATILAFVPKARAQFKKWFGKLTKRRPIGKA